MGYVFAALAIVVIAVFLWIDARSRRSMRESVDGFLRDSICPTCSGAFRNWKGQISPNHYQFAEGEIPDILLVQCSQCDEHSDLFRYDCNRMELSRFQ